MTKTLEERIAHIKEIATNEIQPYDCLDCGSYDDAYYWGQERGGRDVAVEAVKIIEELQAENQALIAKNGELEKEIEEEKLKTFVHQADANCSKRDHESDKIFYRKCLKNIRSERDELRAKVKELEGKIQNISIAHNVEECKKCDGWGWYADHDDMSTHNPDDGSCQSCPVQVQCADCQATGFSQTKTKGE